LRSKPNNTGKGQRPERDRVRKSIVPVDSGNLTLFRFLQTRFGLSGQKIRRLILEHRVRVSGTLARTGWRRLRPGQWVVVTEQNPPKARQTDERQNAPHVLGGMGRAHFKPAKKTAPAPPSSIRIVFMDRHIVIVDKPPGVTAMRHRSEAAEFGPRGRRFLPQTVAQLLPRLIAEKDRGGSEAVRAVHRLDKETSGLMVFARTAEAESRLGKQFRTHGVERTYLALVRGRAADQAIESYLVRDRGDGRRGSTTAAGQGKRALTHVRVIEDLGDFSLIECKLETGRTHQVRIHLGEAGTPICGERIYDRPLHGKPVPDLSRSARVALHSAELRLHHPITGIQCSWRLSLPEDLAVLVRRLRGRKS
jgi:23S rRNA pseudouridine1911/1915/1917 synthase